MIDVSPKTIVEHCRNGYIIYKMEINNFLEEMKCKPGKAIDSTTVEVTSQKELIKVGLILTMQVKDSSLWIRVFPNGRSNKDKGHVVVFLKKKIGKESRIISADFNIGNLKCSFLSIKYEDLTSWGFKRFLTHEECTEILEGDVLKLTLKVKLQQNGFEEENYTKRLMSKIFEDMFEADFSILCQDLTRLPCHKSILAGSSQYLRRLLETDMMEVREFDEDRVFW